MPIRMIVVPRIKGKEKKEYKLEFSKDIISIGRNKANDITLPAMDVSGRHAQILFKDGEYWLVDLGSLNGTMLNNKQIEPDIEMPLRTKDVIRIGSFELNVVIEEFDFTRENYESTTVMAKMMIRDILGTMGSYGEYPAVTVLVGPEKDTRIELKENVVEVVIGRSRECDIVLSDRSVSRRHAKIQKEYDKVLISDLGSLNKTMVNGMEIKEPYMLQDRDEIKLGNVRLIYTNPEEVLLQQLENEPTPVINNEVKKELKPQHDEPEEYSYKDNKEDKDEDKDKDKDKDDIGEEQKGSQQMDDDTTHAGKLSWLGVGLVAIFAVIGIGAVVCFWIILTMF